MRLRGTALLVGALTMEAYSMKRIRDAIVEMDSGRVPQHLHSLAERVIDLGDQIAGLLPRTDKTIAMSNFCNYVGGELRQASNFYPNHVPGLAWCARNLFETNLTVRHVLASEPNFRSWLGQCLRDERDFIDGFLAISKDREYDVAKAQLLNRRSVLDEIASRHGLEYSKLFRIESLARELGVYDEYVGLYKLLSKYVHPSSLLVNSWYGQDPDPCWKNIFIVKLQLYAGDTTNRVAQIYGLEA